MDTHTSTSRWTRLRVAAVVAHTTTLAALILTYWLQAVTVEANPVAAYLFDAIGYPATAAVAMLGIGAVFELYERLDYPAATVGGVALAGVGVLDLGVNLWRLATVDVPTTWVDPAVGIAAVGACAAVVAHIAPVVLPRVGRRIVSNREQIGAVMAAVAMVVTPVAGVAFVGSQPLSAKNSGTAEAASAEDLLYIAGSSEFYALYKANGSRAWFKSKSSGDYEATVYDGNSVYAGGNIGLQRLDPDTGSVTWSRSTSIRPQDIQPFGNTVVVTGQSGSAVKSYYKSNGTVKWSYSHSSGQSLSHINAQTFDKNGKAGTEKIIVSADSNIGGIIGINTTDGSKFDMNKTDNVTNYYERGTSGATLIEGISSTGNTVYVADLYSNATAVDQTGSLKWESPTSANPQGSEVGPDGNVYIPYGNGTAIKYDQQGNTLTKLSSATRANAYTSDTAYYGTSGGLVTSTNQSTKTDNWKKDFTSVSTFDIAVSDSSVSFGASGSTVSGTVTAQDGSPVDNATVQITTVDTKSIQPPSGTDPVDEAIDRLENSSDRTPTAWQPSLDLRGNVFTSAESTYPALTTTDTSNAGSGFYLDSLDVGSPQVRLPANEEIVATAWNPESSTGVFESGLINGEYESQLPGTPKDEATIVFEQLSVTGGVTQRERVTLEQTAGSDTGGFGLDPSTMKYGTTTLSTGYWRVSVTDSPVSYVVQVGEPTEIIDDQVRDVTQQRTQRSQWVTDQIENGPLAVRTVRTNGDGEFSASVDSRVQVVGVQAYKASSLGVDDPTKLQPSDIYQNASQLDGSVYLPSRVYKREVPAQNLTVEMREVTYPGYGDVTDLQNRTDRLQDRLLNETMQNATTAFEQSLDNVTSERLENQTARIRDLADENQALQDRIEDITEQRDLTVPDDASNEELRQEIDALQQAIDSMDTTIEVQPIQPPSDGDTVPDIGDNPTPAEPPADDVENGVSNITRSWAVPGSITADGTLIRLDFANGTTKYVNASESGRVTIDQRVGRSDVVTLSNQPLGDAPAAEVSLIAATDEGVGRSSQTATNPAVNAQVPELKSVAVSSFRPETGETVTVTPHGGSGFRGLANATVYGPTGDTVSTSVANGSATFAPTGTGTHKIQLRMTNLNDTEFVETVTVDAVETGQNRPMSVRPASGPMGEYAIVGDGLQSGAIETEDGGATISITAQAASGTTPDVVHVYTAGIDAPPDATVRIGITEGDAGRAVSQNVRTVIHGPAYTEDTHIYRVGDGESTPLPRGKSPAGIVRVGTHNSTIQTYTTSSGTVGVRTNSNPSVIDEAQWFIATRIPELPFGFVVPHSEVVST